MNVEDNTMKVVGSMFRGFHLLSKMINPILKTLYKSKF